MLSLIQTIGLVDIDFNALLGCALLLYGLVSTYTSFGKDNSRGTLFLSVCVFLLGVLLFVISFFDIPSYRGLYIASVLFITGSAFLILYLQNHIEHLLLFIALFMILLSCITIYFYNSVSIIQFADKIAGKIIDNWELVFILFGFSLLAGSGKES
jgi:hypothetical protein